MLVNDVTAFCDVDKLVNFRALVVQAESFDILFKCILFNYILVVDFQKMYKNTSIRINKLQIYLLYILYRKYSNATMHRVIESLMVQILLQM